MPTEHEIEDGYWGAVAGADKDALPFLAVRALIELCGPAYEDALNEALADGIWGCADDHAGRGFCEAEVSEIHAAMRQSVTVTQALAFFAVKQAQVVSQLAAKRDDLRGSAGQ